MFSFYLRGILKPCARLVKTRIKTPWRASGAQERPIFRVTKITSNNKKPCFPRTTAKNRLKRHIVNSIMELHPLEVAQKAWTGEIKEQDAREYLLSKSPREILEFQNHFPPNQHATSRWFEIAKVILDIRLAENAAKTADKLIQHTEKLTQQTDIHIQHTEKLTRQTDRLVNETAKLTWLTIALGVFAVVQIVIMVFDYIKHK